MSASRSPSTGKLTTSSSVRVRLLLPSRYYRTAVSKLTRRSVCAECDTFSRSSDAVFELSLRFAKPWEQDKSLSPEQALEAKRLMFHELTQICLWGNSTDLSLLINVSVTFWARKRLDIELTGVFGIGADD